MLLGMKNAKYTEMKKYITFADMDMTKKKIYDIKEYVWCYVRNNFRLSWMLHYLLSSFVIQSLLYSLFLIVLVESKKNTNRRSWQQWKLMFAPREFFQRKQMKECPLFAGAEYQNKCFGRLLTLHWNDAETALENWNKCYKKKINFVEMIPWLCYKFSGPA